MIWIKILFRRFTLRKRLIKELKWLELRIENIEIKKKMLRTQKDREWIFKKDKLKFEYQGKLDLLKKIL